MACGSSLEALGLNSGTASSSSSSSGLTTGGGSGGYNTMKIVSIAGFSFGFKSGVPDSYFGAGTPIFQENLTKLHSGTPSILEKCPWDSCFENPSKNPVLGQIGLSKQCRPRSDNS